MLLVIAMLDLLVNGSLFLENEGGSVSQLTGIPLPKVLSQVGRDLIQRQEPKRLRRERIFYSSRDVPNHELPSTHILNSLVTGRGRMPKTEWAHVSSTQARKLALFISQGSFFLLPHLFFVS